MTLALTGEVNISQNLDELYDTLGQDVLAIAKEAVEARGSFHFALSGGSTPKKFYMYLATDIQFRDFPWDKTHLWIVDERRVPEDDEKNNYKMIRETMADHVNLKPENIHPMPVMEADPATLYENEIRKAFGLAADASAKENWPRIDVILLGMGGDCHTASLFPKSQAQKVTDRWIVINEGPEVTPPDRLTMTYPFINVGRYVFPLVTGEGKKEALAQVNDLLEETDGQPSETQIAEVPIAGIMPAEKDTILRWYLDEDAAGVPSGPNEQIELA